MDNIDKKVININYPCIQDIILRKDETDVCFTVSDGQDETKLFFKDGKDVMFTVNFGDVSNIGFGGTDNWGKDRLPLYVNYTKGDTEYDSVFVDTIEIQKLAGDGDWCKCELINNNKNVKYTSLSENPYNVERRAYFYHKTQDDTIKIGYNEGRPASKEWCVTVIQDANPNGKPMDDDCDCSKVEFMFGGKDGYDLSKQDNVRIGMIVGEPDCLYDVEFFTNNSSVITDITINDEFDVFAKLPKVDKDCIGTIGYKVNGTVCKNDIQVKRVGTDTGSSVDLGTYKYKVGLISDLHICRSNDAESGNWWDEDDFKRAMSLFIDDTEVKFVAACGDVAESQTNDYKKHPEAVCDVDYAEIKDMYDVPYWQVAGLRFFTPLGNHDFYGLFESRYGDNIVGKKNSETTVGYNANVSTRIGQLWPTDSGINGIVPGRGRIVFELENGKHTAQGQADMSFFAYNAYVDLYTKQAGYTGSSVWDSSKGGISDEAIRLTKNYVNNNWNSCKDNLSGWKGTGLHGRNGYSKLNYWTKKDNDIYIFLSVDYGNDVWGVTSGWHDRMIHARTIINLNEDDPYIKRMKEYVADTNYSKADEAYNYQYYSPNTLIWLKELLENNKDKKIYIFTHHFMPSRVGNGVGLAKDGNWFYSVISPDGVKDDREGGKYNKGSNALTGVEYWFINKLMNTYKNVLWFNGHSHISFTSNANFDNHEYSIVSPSEKNEYVYTKNTLNPIRESAWCVSLPSLSKPRGIENGQSVRHYEDAEMAIMEVYEKGVKIKGYKIKENNKDVNKLLVEKSIKLI